MYKLGSDLVRVMPHRAQGTGRGAQSTEHRAQSAEHGAQSAGRRAQSTDFKVLIYFLKVGLSI